MKQRDDEFGDDELNQEELSYEPLEDADLEGSTAAREAAEEEEEVVAAAPTQVSSRPHVDADEPIQPEAKIRIAMTGAPIGIRRADEHGFEMLDAMSGRACVFGFGFQPIIEAIQSTAEGYLGDGAAHSDQGCSDDGMLKSLLSELLGDSRHAPSDSIYLCPAADLAIEKAISLARTFRPEKAFRTVALVGSDHGRTGMCRTASGRPSLHEGFGPMMAGFAHVPTDDIKALRSVIDKQTACILLSPIDFNDGVRPVAKDYLLAVRKLCDENEILLIIDESRIAFGSSGELLAYTAIADIAADIVVVAAGLFGGLSGGLVLASSNVTGGSIVDTCRYPLLSAVVAETLSELGQQELPTAAADSMQAFAVSLAEQLSGFEFVRDINVLGMNIGIETDIESTALVRSAARKGIRIEAAGETAVRLQLPLVLTDHDQQTLLTRIGEMMEAIEREAAELSI
jgi:acetylornithine/N-succinyldiaminopimelate aminotransferase